MARLLILVFSAGLLPACANFPPWPLLDKPQQAASPHEEINHYSFAWRLSGNRLAAPLQVFDNGKLTWLQFAPGQTIPSIFQHTDTNDRPLRYQRQGPYVVLSGVWPSLLLRSGNLQSRIDRITAPDDVATTGPLPVQPLVTVTAASEHVAHGITEKVSTAVQPLNSEPPEHKPQAVVPVRLDTATALTQASFQPVVDAPLETTIHVPVNQDLPRVNSRFSVSPQDTNLRTALSRWALAADWSFEPEHWAVDADIPIVGSATFETGFKLAVQDLLASTELADRPLQPCFYSNRVLRVVPYAQTCDRSAGVGS